MEKTSVSDRWRNSNTVCYLPMGCCCRFYGLSDVLHGDGYRWTDGTRPQQHTRRFLGVGTNVHCTRPASEESFAPASVVRLSSAVHALEELGQGVPTSYSGEPAALACEAV